MPREIPAVPTGWQSPRLSAGHSFEMELITPMFGGGVETRINDRDFPIRPTSIRGQLQFWWRATVGAQYATPHELRAAQSAVWGDTTQASRVEVQVEATKVGPLKPCAQFERDNKSCYHSALPYVLFPFQGQLAKERSEIEVKPASCIHGACFTLTLRCREGIDFETQLEPALRAWVNFGGLGSRTRRGCGAIVCKELAPKNRDDLFSYLVKFLQAPREAREWPTLAAAFLVGNTQSDALAAWKEVVQKFRDFRQGEKVGRNSGQQPNRPGRSRWPEPETIRRITNQRLQKHERLKHVPDYAFPRAELGLPIVFHFQESGDPPETVLYPNNDSEGNRRERMASPLILKPLALGNGEFVPLVLRLKTPALEGVDLREGERSLQLPQETLIRGGELAEHPDSPMHGRSSNGSAIEAFLAYAKSQGFEEVKRS